MSEELAYAAAFMDADGYIGLYKHGTYKRAHIGWTNTDRAVLEYIQKCVGGGGYILTRNPNGGRRRQVFYQYVLVSRSARIVLRLLLPYLRIKQGRAEAALADWEARHAGIV